MGTCEACWAADEPKPNDIADGTCCFWGKTRTLDSVFLLVKNSEFVSDVCLSFLALLSVFDSRSQNSLRKSIDNDGGHRRNFV